MYLTNKLSPVLIVILLVISQIFNISCSDSDEQIETPVLSEKLSDAAINGDLDTISKHLKSGGQVNLKSSNGNTMLHLSVHYKKNEVVKLLLAHQKTNPNIYNSLGESALHVAAEKGSVTAAHLLLQHEKIDVNIPTKKYGHDQEYFGKSPLHFTAIFGTLKVAQALLAHQDIKPNLKTNGENTPIMYSLKNGHIGVTNVILSHEKVLSSSVNKDIEELFYNTLNSYYVESKKIYNLVHSINHEKINLSPKLIKDTLNLLKYKKYFNSIASVLTGKKWQSLLSKGDVHELIKFSVKNKSSEVLAAVFKSEENFFSRTILRELFVNSLDYASDKTTYAFIERNDFNPNEVIAFGMNALHLSMIMKRFEVAKKLLKHPDLDINAKVVEFQGSSIENTNLQKKHGIYASYKGDTALHLAYDLSYLWLFEGILKNSKVNPNLLDSNGYSVLHLMSMSREETSEQIKFYQKKMFSRLMYHVKIDINVKDQNGLTPLHLAVENSKRDILLSLLQSAGEKIDPNIESNDGKTIFDLTLSQKYLKYAAKLIVDLKHFDFKQIDSKGNTVLHLLAKAGYDDAISRYMFNYKNDIDINAVNSEGRTALHLAVIDEKFLFIFSFVEPYPLLRSEKIDISIKDKYGKTAVDYAHKTK